MKIVPKTKLALLTNKAESMAEVTVAFMVLSIVITLFAQGLNYANRAENYAIDRSQDSDKAFRELLDTAINSSGSFSVVSDTTEKIDGQNLLKLKGYKKPYGSDYIFFYVFDAKLN